MIKAPRNTGANFLRELRKKKCLPEYLRRNLHVCAAYGAQAGAENALHRLMHTQEPPKWLVEALKGVVVRLADLPAVLAEHRDEVSPYKKQVKK